MTNAAPQNSLTIYNFAPAATPVLAGALGGLRSAVQAAAQANLDALLASDPDYTETEIQAMLRIEALRQVNGVDLAAILMRAEMIDEIERTNAIQNHPANYASMQEMARDQGISAAELSQTLDLGRIIFPYIENVLHLSVPLLWEEIGKSNFRELTPVLKTIITGQPSATNSVNQSAEQLLDSVAATARSAGQEVSEGEVQQRAVAQLLEHGATLNNAELRTQIRPGRTPNIRTSLLRHNGTVMAVMEMSEDQYTMFQRRLQGHIDPLTVTLPDDPRQRQVEAARVPEIRRLLQLLEAR